MKPTQATIEGGKTAGIGFTEGFATTVNIPNYVKHLTPEAKELFAAKFLEMMNNGFMIEPTQGDARYLKPKEEPKVSNEQITQTIEETRIYNEAKQIILNAQRRQVGYGIEKYPEPLNADTWTIGETIDHIIDESIDKLHYLVMLKIKLGHAEAKKRDDLSIR